MVAARRRGLSFTEFWREAVRPGMPLVLTTTENPPAGAVRWPSDRNDRLSWQRSIESTREGWKRAFERVEQSRGERAIAFLADAIGAVMDAEGADGEPLRDLLVA